MNAAARENPAAHWHSDGESVRCTLCPHVCTIGPGKRGTCGVRENRDGALTLPFYGRISALNIDPIEKKPLYHFHPGSTILSVGFLGCNFRCPFCQNYEISQSTTRRTEFVEPQKLVESALESRSAGIAYTYNEPTIHFEYVTRTATLARNAGLKNVLVSNGYLNPKPARELLQLMDAANIDLKSANPDFYRTELGGGLKEVERFLRIAAESCHLEVTTLLIPGKNDSPEEVDAIAGIVASLGRATPLHISAYYPTYKYTVPGTTVTAVENALRRARKQLTYVYAGNVPGGSETLCSSCGATLVRRRGYTVDRSGLAANRCASCGAATPIFDA